MEELIKTIEQISASHHDAVKALAAAVELTTNQLTAMSEQIQSLDRRLSKLESFVYQTEEAQPQSGSH